jgi:hypothetical protein
MFCRGCGYALIGLPSNRCPECGREFDLSDPRTFLAHPRQSALPRIVKVVVVLFCLTLPLDGYIGYLAWQVHDESKAIQILEANGSGVNRYYNIMPSWAEGVIPERAAWLWKRAEDVDLGWYSQNVAQSLEAVGHLKSLRIFVIVNPTGKPIDLVHLKELTALEWLSLGYSSVTDAGLAQLKGLTALQDLGIGGSDLTDAGLANLKGFTALQHLGISSPNMTDAGLAQLKTLSALEILVLNETKVTDAGVADFRKALPECKVYRMIKGLPKLHD